MDPEPQESSRSISAGTKVTPEEKDALRLVCMVDKTTEYALFRGIIPGVMERAAEIREQLESLGNADESVGSATGAAS